MALLLSGSGLMGKGILNTDIYKQKIHHLDIYEQINEINNYDLIVLPVDTDLIFLERNKEELLTFLGDENKFLLSFAPFINDIFSKHLIYHPSSMEIKDREIRIIDSTFKGIREYDLNYRRGVKGFFCRGHINAFKDAKWLLNDNEHECVAAYWKEENKAHILASAGADLLGFGLFDTTTARLLGIRTFEFIESVFGQIERIK